MSSLLTTGGIHVGRRFNLTDRIVIGRADDNVIALPDHLVSRYHAEIVRVGTHFEIHDLGSKNGIRVNGKNVTKHRLRRGDQLQVGKTTFVLESPMELRAARFSDVIVQLETQPDLDMQTIRDDRLPPPPKNEATDLVILIGRLLDCESEELSEALNDMLHQVMERHRATAGAILLSASGGSVAPLVADSQGVPLRLGHDATQKALVDGQAVLTAGRSQPTAQGKLQPNRAMLVPLLHHDRVFGALYIERTGEEEFTQQDLGFLMALARVVSGAVRHTIQMDQLVLSAAETPSEPFVGISDYAQNLRDQVRRVAASNATVLLTGETGTGKELIAHAIHTGSERAEGPFVAINCSAIPANLVESELFGHEAGAFTGADRLKRGKIELADGGTLFLDEIGDMQFNLQPKLLRFIEELVFYRVGGLRPIQSDVRIVTATNRDLETAVREERFRQDLLFRLNVMPIHLAPLREHPEDVRLLVEHFAPPLATRLGKPFLGLVEETWGLLASYPWPGNVREVRHSLERALILSDDGILRPEHFQLTLPEPTAGGSTAGGITPSRESSGLEPTRPRLSAGPLAPPTMAEAEAEAIRRALRFAGGNRVQAAKILHIHRNTLAKKIQNYKIET